MIEKDFVTEGLRRTRIDEYLEKELEREIITFLHGKEEYEKAVSLAEHLFNNKFQDLSKKDIEDLFKNQEKTPVEAGWNIVDFVVNVGVAKR